MHLSESLTYTVASSDVNAVPLAVIIPEDSLEFRIVSPASAVKSLALTMRIDAPKSTTNFFDIESNLPLYLRAWERSSFGHSTFPFCVIADERPLLS